MLPLTDDFKEIVLNERPLIDLRAPVEYQKGSFPNSINLPLMTDEEREQVGICYKEKGHDAALTLGHELVQGEKKEERLQNWTTFIDAHPDTLLFCFRGGNRSEIVQQWIFEKTQKKVPRLTGGYKKFRHYLMDSLNPQNISTKPLILTGFTGSGKTEILKQFEHAIDLEGLANHRGSSFGGKISSQPTQVNFENKLAYQIIQHQHKQFAVLLLEDESRNIGR
ncbi:MAG TPA: tRNA 2-selenouridine(34) synthase MnmH, partial [Eubacteriaceae bacterium]|nr:tRNA 2-selenouridine(34) synthase MnmH [Eubacteriaceae bacterium]